MNVEVYGGFNVAPKFPTPPNINFLFRYYALNADSRLGNEAKEMALYTLKKIANGGIHDHLAGGFHRYSVDQYWHISHYEKMLYDQSQLAVAFLEAYQISKDELYSFSVKKVFNYVREYLTHPDGGVYSAEDADSLNEDGKSSEGAFYVW